jgi:Gas vesicle protein G
MGLFTFPFRLPFRPLQGFIRLAEVIGDEAERKLNDPVRIRRELEEAQRRHADGEISDEEFAEIENEIASRFVSKTYRPAAPTDAAAAGNAVPPADDDRS